MRRIGFVEILNARKRLLFTGLNLWSSFIEYECEPKMGKNLEEEKPRSVKRTGFEVMSDILRFCSEPRSPTKIIYQTNLSYKASKTYLAKLCSLGLLIQNSRKYVTTDKGRQFISELEKIANTLESSDPTTG